jgi:hypothetical protein
MLEMIEIILTIIDTAILRTDKNQVNYDSSLSTQQSVCQQ